MAMNPTVSTDPLPPEAYRSHLAELEQNVESATHGVAKAKQNYDDAKAALREHKANLAAYKKG